MSLINPVNSESLIEFTRNEVDITDISLDNLRLQNAILRLINCRESKK